MAFLDIEATRAAFRRVIDDAQQDYQERYEADMLDRRPLVRELVDQAVARHFPERTGRMLDVGCGTAFYAPVLAPVAEELIGVDICGPMLDEARLLASEKGLTNCTFVEASAENLPFEDGHFDVVHSWDFLHHVPDVKSALSEVRRVLKPGGRYLAIEANVINPSIFWYALRRTHEWRLFTQNQLTLPRTLERLGFDVRISYDNTVISYLSARTMPLWHLAEWITERAPMHLLRFRYIMDCRL